MDLVIKIDTDRTVQYLQGERCELFALRIALVSTSFDPRISIFNLADQRLRLVLFDACRFL